MLASASPMKKSMLGSALAGTSLLRPKGARARRTVVTSLMLTSLVDAFSILVIFLIMNHSSSVDVVDIGKVTLPLAKESQFIQEGVVVRIEGDKFIVGETPVELSALAAALKAAGQAAEGLNKEGLILVADKSLDFADLSPVILAGSNAGFTKFKFAVVRDE